MKTNLYNYIWNAFIEELSCSLSKTIQGTRYKWQKMKHNILLKILVICKQEILCIQKKFISNLLIRFLQIIDSLDFTN